MPLQNRLRHRWAAQINQAQKQANCAGGSSGGSTHPPMMLNTLQSGLSHQ